MEGIKRIEIERRRQIRLYGWTKEHGIERVPGEQTRGAIAYAAKAMGIAEIPDLWPWPDDGDLRPDDPTISEQITQLAKAGALLAAEIDRLIAIQKGP